MVAVSVLGVVAADGLAGAVVLDGSLPDELVLDGVPLGLAEPTAGVAAAPPVEVVEVDAVEELDVVVALEFFELRLVRPVRSALAWIAVLVVPHALPVGCSRRS